MDNLDIVQLTSQALAMISNTYFFDISHPAFPSINSLGNCRVVGFAINETLDLELLLLLEGSEDPDFYRMTDLTVSSIISQAA